MQLVPAVSFQVNLQQSLIPFHVSLQIISDKERSTNGGKQIMTEQVHADLQSAKKIIHFQLRRKKQMVEKGIRAEKIPGSMAN